MINKPLIEHLEMELKIQVDNSIKIVQIERVGGGDINDAFKLYTNQKAYFLKVNNSQLPGLFETEGKGLKELKHFSSFQVPDVITNGSFQNDHYLILEFLDFHNSSNWSDFGNKLAQLHSQKQPFYGLAYHNYIGSLAQKNNSFNTWNEFYITQRLEPLMKIAIDNAYLEIGDQYLMERLYNALPQVFPVEHSSLLHGDLWKGNVGFVNHKACIYDPAIYYGHREMDIAMSLLFGGFPDEMYAAYQEVYPLEKSWKERVDVAQLYPLLVHVILFGGAYSTQLRNTLKRF